MAIDPLWAPEGEDRPDTRAIAAQIVKKNVRMRFIVAGMVRRFGGATKAYGDYLLLVRTEGYRKVGRLLRLQRHQGDVVVLRPAFRPFFRTP